ncbi:hypothetical protein GALMADRAFT_143445 [Galerina marginata CBS 339.88]|uniref:Uncharacterized protein n=1 Tax=Galerina marginata (strain CBS 339.88) TaxID=685588 RepID=A0A067SPZ3_GALM3|nr:hypothetical protein GALMADRAFT_143445 [Galerina marginata CBS 339.88]
MASRPFEHDFVQQQTRSQNLTTFRCYPFPATLAEVPYPVDATWTPIPPTKLAQYSKSHNFELPTCFHGLPIQLVIRDHDQSSPVSMECAVEGRNESRCPFYIDVSALLRNDSDVEYIRHVKRTGIQINREPSLDICSSADDCFSNPSTYELRWDEEGSLGTSSHTPHIEDDELLEADKGKIKTWLLMSPVTTKGTDVKTALSVFRRYIDYAIPELSTEGAYVRYGVDDRSVLVVGYEDEEAAMTLMAAWNTAPRPCIEFIEIRLSPIVPETDRTEFALARASTGVGRSRYDAREAAFLAGWQE